MTNHFKTIPIEIFSLMLELTNNDNKMSFYKDVLCHIKTFGLLLLKDEFKDSIKKLLLTNAIVRYTPYYTKNNYIFDVTCYVNGLIHNSNGPAIKS